MLTDWCDREAPMAASEWTLHGAEYHRQRRGFTERLLRRADGWYAELRSGTLGPFVSLTQAWREAA
jgi:hypothetical protein